MILYRVRNWKTHFENNRTRELKEMSWVPVSNKMDGDNYIELVDHPNGAAHLGAWLAIVEIASRCTPRGTLARSNATSPQEGAGVSRPHTIHSLSRISRLPMEVFQEAIPRLISIGWVESEVVESVEVAALPQEGASKPQEGASSRARAERNGTERTEGKEAVRAIDFDLSENYLRLGLRVLMIDGTSEARAKQTIFDLVAKYGREEVARALPITDAVRRDNPSAYLTGILKNEAAKKAEKVKPEPVIHNDGLTNNQRVLAYLNNGRDARRPANYPATA